MTPPRVFGLSLLQPWATLVAREIKRVETRAWRPHDLMPQDVLLIHASKGKTDGIAWMQACTAAGVDTADSSAYPRGAILALAHVAFVVPSTGATPRLMAHVGPAHWGIERQLGDWSPGRWLWAIDGVARLQKPVPCVGALGLWTPDPLLLGRLRGAGLDL